MEDFAKIEGSWAKLSTGKWGVRVDHYGGGTPNNAGELCSVVSRSGERKTVRLGGRVDRRSYCSIYAVAREPREVSEETERILELGRLSPEEAERRQAEEERPEEEFAHFAKLPDGSWGVRVDGSPAPGTVVTAEKKSGERVAITLGEKVGPSKQGDQSLFRIHREPSTARERAWAQCGEQPLTGGALADAMEADRQAARDGYNPNR